ncbi:MULTISPECIES: flagellar basal body L-ring protein FlgH [Marinobacter]|uniref:flagellar basal body L-ring protein FlgH n=1 Tax=Marinobacter TaxID=2742 RepID=UPI001D074E16|nr:flagellar basal body L-ring protein FlgH [Marinobacter sp. CA1]MCG8517634.1 flagellar basal body L-ring protein FlgH [Pseudomonadales bacterium]MCK7567357.1 flagellar basal body L-ring protein FlgH [Marinobacter xestospongiae]
MRSLTLLLTLASLLLAGCQSAHYDVAVPQPGEEAWAPTVVDASEARRGPGSLYASAQLFTLFQDRRAYRIGDILTVTLDEATESSKRSGASMGKSSGLSMGAPTFGTKTIEELTAELNAQREFSGEASANQRNSLSGYITVTVADVMANGVLSIKGEKWLRLNQGDEFIRLKGLVRVDDIDDGNRISSQRIANAQITYAGRGSLAEANQPGWLTRFFQSPLFPF